ncbi:DNA topoisomerase I subunit omega, partial [Vibrio anguillarum]
ALPPFVTSTLLQAASTKLGLSADKAMSTAQALYEAGLITYHRTDCPNYDAESLKLIRSFISQWQQRKGTNSYLPAEPNTFKAKEGAQEGHEAIRPSILEADISSISDPTQKAMYQMIFCRT